MIRTSVLVHVETVLPRNVCKTYVGWKLGNLTIVAQLKFKHLVVINMPIMCFNRSTYQLYRCNWVPLFWNQLQTGGYFITLLEIYLPIINM